MENMFMRKYPHLYHSIHVKHGISSKKCHLSDINPALSLFAGKNNLLVLN